MLEGPDLKEQQGGKSTQRRRPKPIEHTCGCTAQDSSKRAVHRLFLQCHVVHWYTTDANPGLSRTPADEQCCQLFLQCHIDQRGMLLMQMLDSVTMVGTKYVRCWRTASDISRMVCGSPLVEAPWLRSLCSSSASATLSTALPAASAPASAIWRPVAPA